jgi:DNA repair protein RadC
MRINTPQSSVKYWNSVVKGQSWFDENKEHLVLLILSIKYDIQGYSLVSIGGLNESIAHPREIFRAAIASGAYAIIVMHNHPSGDPTPSAADRELIELANKAGELLAIRVLDQIIVGKNGSYFSSRKEAESIAEKKRRPQKLRKRQRAK